MHPPYGYAVGEAERPIDPQDPSKGMVKHKIQTYQDPQTGIKVVIPMDEPTADDVGGALLNKRVSIDTMIPEEFRGKDLTKEPDQQ